MRSAAVRDPDELEELVGAIAQVAAAHALDAALQHQVLAARAELVDAGVLRHVADRAPHGVLRAANVVPGHRGRAFVRMGQRHEDAHGRRLARAVRAQQAEDLAFADAEGDAVQRLHLAVALAQRVDDDRIHRQRG